MVGSWRGSFAPLYTAIGNTTNIHFPDVYHGTIQLKSHEYTEKEALIQHFILIIGRPSPAQTALSTRTTSNISSQETFPRMRLRLKWFLFIHYSICFNPFLFQFGSHWRYDEPVDPLQITTGLVDIKFPFNAFGPQNQPQTVIHRFEKEVLDLLTVKDSSNMVNGQGGERGRALSCVYVLWSEFKEVDMAV